MQIDMGRVKELQRDTGDLNTYIDNFIKKCMDAGDTPLLSDIISRFNDGGIWVLEALAEKYEQDRDMPLESRFRWKLFVKRDEWGNEPCKGDIILRKIQKPLFHDKDQRKVVGSNERKLDKLNGTYDEKWTRTIPYTTDERGCITCEFNDAVFFIRSFGIHPKSGRGGPPLSQHLWEHTQDVAEAPDGSKLHAWYHRFVEMDKESYEKLPILKERKTPKRGFKND